MMDYRPFLSAAGWGGAQSAPLAGDASARRYLRLTRGPQSAILMVAPVNTIADRTSFDGFRHVGAHLRTLVLSAPKEYAFDPSNGLILMEDFGDLTLSNLLRDDPGMAYTGYRAAAALLPRLAAPPPSGLKSPDAAAMAGMVRLTFDLLPGSDALRVTLLAALAQALGTHAPGPHVLSLRDVHGDNLLWLPDRTGDARIGLLDYQDALMLPEGYDLASLLDDPRREVPEAWRAELVAEFSTPPRIAILSLQRNLRILGIFHRLATRLGKPSYGAFLPRTRGLVTRAADTLPTLRKPVAELLERTADWGTQ